MNLAKNVVFETLASQVVNCVITLDNATYYLVTTMAVPVIKNYVKQTWKIRLETYFVCAWQRWCRMLEVYYIYATLIEESI